MAAEFPPAPAQKRGRPWLIIIGGVLVVLALLLCVVGGVTTFTGVQDLAEQEPHTGSYTIQLEEGESTGVWSEDPATSCTATGPTGDVTDPAFGTSTVTWGDTELTKAIEVDATTTGEYTISCTSPFVVGDGFSAGSIITGVIGGAVCVLASLLLLVGVILWAVRRR